MDVTVAGVEAELALPCQREVFAYWSSLCGERRMPARDAFRPAKIIRRLPTISLIDVCGEPARYRVRLAGTGLREVFGLELTGREIDELPIADQPGYWRGVYETVTASGRPAHGFAALSWRGRPNVVQAWLRLPMSDDGDRVNMVLGYDRFIQVERQIDRQALRAAAREPQAAMA